MANNKSYKMSYSMYEVLVFLLLFCSPLLAQPSLLFTEKEVELIHENISHQTDQQHPEMLSGRLYLEAIVYVDADHWTLWLNNKMIHSHDPHTIDGFHIDKVTAVNVIFSWISQRSA